MTIAELQALGSIIADAIQDIVRVYDQAQPQSEKSESGVCPASPPRVVKSSFPLSPPNSPNAVRDGRRFPVAATAFARSAFEDTEPEIFDEKSTRTPIPTLTPPPPNRLPLLNHPVTGPDPGESLTHHPTVVSASARIVAAAGQLTALVRDPFMSLCDASMGYHLPSCLRFLEATHTVDVLASAGSEGLHVDEIAHRLDDAVCPRKLAHALRLLATHHLLREVRPDTFALNRISALMATGKRWEDVLAQ